VRTINKVQAVSIAVIVFIALHYLLWTTLNYLVNHSGNISVWLTWINLTAYNLYIISGIIAGALSKDKLILVGAVAGFISGLSAILMLGVAGDAFGNFVTLSSGAFLGGIGGAISLFFKKRFINAL